VTHPPEVLLHAARFRVERVLQTAPDGQPRARDVVRHPGSVVVLPLVDPQHVCLIRNYRIAVTRQLIELPAGTLDGPEPPLQAAQRELWEETGYRAAHWQPLAAFYPAPGILDELMHLYVATELTPGPPRREVGEEIENLVVTWDEALALVRRGDIQDAKTLVGLLLFHFLQRGR